METHFIIPPEAIKENGQNMRNNGFLTWDIRQKRVMITDRENE